ncbi:uncharacterized protein EDB91DRAFT_1251665 [Suillus paluster]|uniref:uncharacterized protein n=1 Tax=Suillus paluster TaxID=48578 RepID=UPI001B875587|nr:uncharacterized protein EDB91DRAFT_1251665 [Suillus paluster]KAG1732616.1 hypothetical protein EDB91DRAFT_1251665 [Suillus paluster]
MQSALPAGATLLGMILSSDKTTITSLTGNCIAHPLLISLANLHMNMRSKLLTNSFVLTVLLPVLKFVQKKKCMKGVLQDCLIHQFLDLILRLLKQAAKHGIMLSDPIGRSRYCFTTLASYIVDMPEAMMLLTVGGKTSPVTMVMYMQFGDSFWHEPRTRSTTLAQLAVVCSRADPNDLEAHFCEAQKFHLNGVDKPFWSDWIFADPSYFLTPETLHHIHKEFYNHDAQWLIVSVGESEINFHFSVLQPITSFQHFHEGILKLKQVTVSVDAVPPSVLAAVCVLMQFRYLVQLPRIDENNLKLISGALDEFHVKKDMIITAGARCGQHNNSIVPSIHNSGVTSQWTADITEHITEIKDPARSSNNINYDPQICRHLNRADKCRRFELAINLLDCDQSLQDVDIDPKDNVDT